MVHRTLGDAHNGIPLGDDAAPHPRMKNSPEPLWKPKD